MPEEEKQLFNPAEAADFLTEMTGRKITVARLAQLRRAGKVRSTRLGYNETVYKLEDLKKADVSLGRAGRKPEKRGSADEGDKGFPNAA